LRRPMDRFL